MNVEQGWASEGGVLEGTTLINKFIYSKPSTYYNFAFEPKILDNPNKVGNTFIFDIKAYGDLASKVYLKFNLPALIPHQTSKWACWTNAIGFFIIDKLELCVNNEIIETLTGNTMYTHFLSFIKNGQKNMIEKMIGLYKNDIELRKNAKQSSQYTIPLHLFFTQTYHNAFPLNRNDLLQIKLYFTPKSKRFISSNMMHPNDYDEISPSLDVEYIYLSKDETDQMNTTNLNYIIQVKNNVNVPIFNNNPETDLSLITNNIISGFQNVSNILTNSYIGFHDNLVNYTEWALLSHPEYVSFYDNFINHLLIPQTINSVQTNETNDIELFIHLNSQYDYIFENSQIYFQSIQNYIEDINSTFQSSSFLEIIHENYFHVFSEQSIDYSLQKYIQQVYDSISTIKDFDYNSTNIRFFINSAYAFLENEVDVKNTDIFNLDNERIQLQNSWYNQQNDENINDGSLISIEYKNNILTHQNSELSIILENYQSLKNTIETTQLPPLDQYVQTFMNTLEVYLNTYKDKVMLQGYFESDLNIFSYNNRIYSNNSIIYQSPGNYNNTFYFDYSQNVYPPAGIPPDDPKEYSIRKYMFQKEFQKNSMFMTYYVDNANSIIENVISYTNLIQENETINIHDYNNAIDVIDGLNLIVSNQTQIDYNISSTDNTNNMNVIESNIHNNITNVLHDVIQKHKNVFYNKALVEKRDVCIETIENVSKYLYSIINIDEFIHQSNNYDETLLTINQMKEFGYQSNTILENISSYMHIIETFEDIYKCFEDAYLQVHTVMEYNSEYQIQSEMPFRLVHSLLQNKNNDFVNFMMKVEFSSQETFNFETSHATFNSCMQKTEGILNSLWISQFKILAKNYPENIAMMYIQKHIEHIKKQKYIIQPYILNISRLNLLDIYDELTKFHYSNHNFIVESSFDDDEYILLGILHYLNKQRDLCVLYDTLEYNLNNVTQNFLKTVSYPIKIENMNVAQLVYDNLYNDILIQIEHINKQIIENNSVSNAITRINDEIQLIENVIADYMSKMTIVDNIFVESLDLYKYKFNTIDSYGKSFFISFFDNNVALYEQLTLSNSLIEKQNETNSNINALQDVILQNVSNFAQESLKTYTLEFNFDFFKKLPIKALVFSIQKHTLYRNRNNFSKLEHNNANISKVTFTIDSAISTFTSSELRYIKPFFYGNKVSMNDIFVLPFCIDIESIQPSGAFHPPSKQVVRIDIDILSKSHDNISINMQAIQYQQLLLYKN